MAFLVPDEGELFLLQKIQVAGLWALKTLALYKNNYTPIVSSVFADFTEADFSGYSPSVAAVAFAAATEVSNKAQMVDAAARVFTHSGGATANTVYGYFYYEAASGKVMWAERFPAPVTMSTAGDNISIQMTVKLNGV